MKILIVISLVFTLIACELVGVMNAMTTAHVYVNKETGHMIYCSNKHNRDPKDFRYAGTANVNPKNIKKCYLAN